MATATRRPSETPGDPRTVDQRVTLHGISWEQYEAFLAMRGESTALRVTYLDGELEIMSPSTFHELDKKKLARLIEAWADASGTPLEGTGAWTIMKRSERRGAEADESYVLLAGDRTMQDVEHPDFAIEVVWTSGGIDTLEVWRGLGVPEVWFWEDGELRFYHLADDGSGYVRRDSSTLLPDLDTALIVECMAEETQTAAVRKLRDALARR